MRSAFEINCIAPLMFTKVNTQYHILWNCVWIVYRYKYFTYSRFVCEILQNHATRNKFSIAGEHHYVLRFRKCEWQIACCCHCHLIIACLSQSQTELESVKDWFQEAVFLCFYYYKIRICWLSWWLIRMLGCGNQYFCDHFVSKMLSKDLDCDRLQF
jgi:hypothetical protein